MISIPVFKECRQYLRIRFYHYMITWILEPSVQEACSYNAHPNRHILDHRNIATNVAFGREALRTFVFAIEKPPAQICVSPKHTTIQANQSPRPNS